MSLNKLHQAFGRQTGLRGADVFPMYVEAVAPVSAVSGKVIKPGTKFCITERTVRARKDVFIAGGEWLRPHDPCWVLASRDDFRGSM